MSEKFAERPLSGGRPATETSPTAAGPALSPQERADRELAQIDEQLDVILAKPENRAALVNRPDQALQPPAGRSITPSVSAPVEASGINHLVLNCIVPGLGSLLHGRSGLGLAQLGLLVAAVPVLFFKLWLGLLLAVVAYVWSIGSGIGFVGQSTKTWR
jgi:hypothetical protein